MESMLSALHNGFNKTFQVQLLIHIIKDEEMMRQAMDSLEVDDFELPTCQVVWEAAADYYRQYRAMPSMSILQLQVAKVVQNAENKFKSYIMPEEQEALADLMELISGTDALNSDYFRTELPHYVLWIRSSRVIGQYSTAIKAGARPGHLISQLSTLERTVNSSLTSDTPFSFISSEPEVITTVNTPPRVTTGVPKLDAILSGGPQPGEIGLVTACPGVGKSNILIHLCVAANYAGIRSLFLTLELSRARIKHRYLAMSAGIDADRLKEPVETWGEEDLYRLYTVTRNNYPTFNMAAITEHNTSKVTISMIEGFIDRWRTYHRQQHGSDSDALLVCIDWQKYIIPPNIGRKVEQWEESDVILRELRFVAERQGVVIWSANQGKSNADGKSILRMNDTAFGYHANDALDIGIGVGLGAQSRVTEDTMESGGRGDRHLVFSVNKNRNGDLKACELYRSPTLRLFDNEVAYATHRAATKSKMHPANLQDPSIALNNARKEMTGETVAERMRNVG